MKTFIRLFPIVALAFMISCNQGAKTKTKNISSASDGISAGGWQENVQDSGDNVKVNVKDGKTILNNSATIVASISASNGIIYLIDRVQLPPAKK